MFGCVNKAINSISGYPGMRVSGYPDMYTMESIVSSSIEANADASDGAHRGLTTTNSNIR